MWTQVACEPFVIVCASRCRRVEVCCIAHCDWFMTNIWNAMYFPVSFCFAFGIARRRKDATNGLIPSLGRVERVQYGETEDWLWRTLIASGMNELFTTDTFIPTRLRRMEKIVFTFPSFAYILQNILLLSNSSVEHENQKPRAKGKKNAYEIVKWIIPRRICRRSNWSNHKHIKRRIGTKKAARTFSSIRMNFMGREWRTSQHFTAYTL